MAPNKKAGKKKAPPQASRQSERVAQKKRPVEETETQEEATEVQAVDMKWLQSALEKASSTVPIKKKKKGDMNPIEQAQHMEIAKGVQHVLFPKLKFIRDETMLTTATGILFDELDLKEKEGLNPQQLEITKQIWVQKWQEIVRKAHNDHRNYCQQSLCDVVKNVLLAGKLADLPTKEELEMAILRKGMADEDPKAARMRDIFVFYWDRMLPCVCGFQRWGPNHKYQKTISAAKLTAGNGKKKACVTESDEAFLCVLHANALEKWKYSYIDMKHKRNQKDWTKEESEKIPPTPYTNSKAGQVRFGG